MKGGEKNMEENKDLFNFSDEDKREQRFFKFEKEGDTVIGILERIDDGAYGKQLIITTPEKKQISIGSYASLSDKIKEDDIGKPIKIVFNGEKKSEKGKTYFDFDVYIKDK